MERALNADERIEVLVRPHWKRLILPTVALVVIVGFAAFALGLVPAGRWHHAAQLTIIAIALALLTRGCVIPYLAWRAWRLTITDRRILLRSGVVRRRGRDIPLLRVTDVSFEAGVIDRLLRCGRLMVESGGEHSRMVLDDVPHPEWTMHQIQELVADEADRVGRRGGAVGDW